jgi:hypothetical protein
MTELPADAERLFSVEPGEFVAERRTIARVLRDAGRTEDAAAVEAIRKPSAVVLAVNRAARDRPKAARAAADAAARVAKSQLGGDPDEFRRALGELEDALELLAEVALAHVAPAGKSPTEAMRRRVRDLLRAAVADDAAREALARGILTEETEAAGFSPFAGMAPRPGGKKRAAGRRREVERRAERRRKLQAELELAEKELRAAEDAARAADQARARAERAVASLRRKLEED